jgi:hypothetical protein
MPTEDLTRDFFDSYRSDFTAIYDNRNGLINSVVNRLFRKSMRFRDHEIIDRVRPVQPRV